MPTVPTKLANNPAQRISVRATPDAFGGAVAEGQGNLGAGLFDQAEQENRRLTIEAEARGIKRLSHLRSGAGDPNDADLQGIVKDELGPSPIGYDHLRGKNATETFKPAKDSVRHIIGKTVDELKSAGVSDIYIARLTESLERAGAHDLEAMTSHFFTQNEQVKDGATQAFLEGQLNRAVVYKDSSNARNSAIFEAHDGIINRGAEAGRTLEEINAELRGFSTDVYSRIVSDFIAENDLQSASEVVAWMEGENQRLVETGEEPFNAEAITRLKAALTSSSNITQQELAAEGSEILANMELGLDQTVALHSWREKTASTSGIKKGSRLDRLNKKLQEANDVSDALREFNYRPLSEQLGELETLSSTPREDMTRQQALEQDALTKSYNTTIKLLDQGQGLELYARHVPGVSERMGTIDFSQPIRAEELRSRAALAAQASEHYGRTISMFTPAEVGQLAGIVQRSHGSEGAEFLIDLSTNLEPAQRTLIAGDLAIDQGLSEIGVAMLNPAVAADVLNGLKVKRELKDTIELTADKRRGKLDNVEVFRDMPIAVQDMYIDAADALYYSRMNAKGKTSWSGSTYEQALEDVLGNPVEFNGREVLPMFPGQSEDDFEQVIFDLTIEDLTTLSHNSQGAPVWQRDGVWEPFDLEQFGADNWLFDGTAQLISRGPGLYAIAINNRTLRSGDNVNREYILDLRQREGE